MPDRPNDPDNLTPGALLELRRALDDPRSGVTDAPPEDAAVFDAALVRLAELVDAILQAEPADRDDRIQDLLGDGDMIRGLAKAGARRNEIETALVPLHQAQFRGSTGWANRVRDLVKDAKKSERQLRVATEGEGAGLPTLLAQSLGEHEIPLLVEPEGWVVSNDGVLKRNASEDNPVTRLNHRPLLITGRLQDLYSPQQHLHIEWPGWNGWEQHIVSRGDALSARGLEGLSHIGAPVSGANAKRAVAYLEAFEAANRHRLPTAYASSRMGWCGEGGRHGFLVGRTLIREDGERDVSTPRGPTEWGDDWVHLDVTGGFDQVVEGYTRSGSFQAWRAAVERVRDYPVAFLGLYAGLVSPLLGVLKGAPNFIMDWSFTSSTGKTTTLRLPASLWGYPEDKDPRGIIGNWDFTTTSLERTLAFHSFLPVLLDDTKRAKNPEWVIPSVLYMVAQGRGKGRGSIDGVRTTATWKTVVLSTGEVPIVAFSQDVGARARTICIQDKPFGETSDHTRLLVERLTLDLLDNHGHAGPMVVRWLLQHRERWPAFQERYEQLRDAWSQQIGTNHFGGRAAPFLALLEMAAGLAEHVLGIPKSDAALHVALDAVRSSSEDADRAKAALEMVYNWFSAHPDRFWDRWHPKDAPKTGWAGVLFQPWKDQPPQALCLLPHVLDEVLSGQGFDTQGVLAEWWDRGWMVSNESGGAGGRKSRRQFRTSLGNGRPRTYALSFEAIGTVVGEEIDDAR